MHQAGADDYITKPLHLADLDGRIDRALESRATKTDSNCSKTGVRDRHRFDNMIGRSAAMQQVFQIIQRAAQTSATDADFGPNRNRQRTGGARFTTTAIGRANRLSTSTAVRFRNNARGFGLFGHQKARLPAPPRYAKVCLKPRKGHAVSR